MTTSSILIDVFLAAVAAAMPGPATVEALTGLSTQRWPRVWVFALGKAARSQSEAAVAELMRLGREIAGGALVGPVAFPPPHEALAVYAGEHPLPGPGSASAATRLGEVVGRVRQEDVALVLLSGGASSLVAAPAEGVEAPDVPRLFELLLASGLDITRVNAVRKRFTRWSAGRLAVALPGRVYCLVVSDVLDDDLASIGSGPCVPDPLSAADVRRILRDAALLERLPDGMRAHLDRVERGEVAETPKPGASAFERVSTRVVASNRTALQAAAARARALGIDDVLVAPKPLTGEAADQGRRIADELLAVRGRPRSRSRRGRACLLWGGETTVTLPHVQRVGGRCQELALAAAQRLHDANADGVSLLAAGTDGRDGPTDAAGAQIDARTWDAVRHAGRKPADDLRAHDSYTALNAAGALVRTGLTNTNVGDVVVGMVEAVKH